MTQIVDFKAAHIKREEQKSIQKQKDYMNWLISELSKGDLLQLIEAMETGDEELFKQITEPVVRRRAIREFNQGARL